MSAHNSKLTAGQLLLLDELQDFAPVKRFRPGGFTSRRGTFFNMKQVDSLVKRNMVEMLHESPQRLVLTDLGRAAIGERTKVKRSA